jgi:general stress protein YciG
VKPKNKAAQELGRKGGMATGQSKSRGDSDYYRKLAKKSIDKRKRLRALSPP